MRRVSRAFLLALVATVPFACTDAAPGRLVGPDGLAPDAGSARFTEIGGIKVMSQNMYLGANIDLLLTADEPEEVGLVFNQLTISTLAGNFGRARKLAEQIATQSPHLVGLQEVSRYEMGGTTLDFLEVLQAYLMYFHAQYGTPTYELIRNDLTTVAFPSTFGFPAVVYADGDAILVRSDVAYDDATMAPYDAVVTMNVAGTSFEYHRGYMAVTAEIEGQRIRFGNTHLEVQMFEPVQLLQTAELIEAFQDETLPVILVGDFNSAANHDAPEDQKTPSYRMLRNAGYADLWLRDPHSVDGYTCCQAPDLTNETSELTQRLDLVLVRYGNAGFGGQNTMEIVGEQASDRIGVSLPTEGGVMTYDVWPSDHAGVVATFWPAPGQAW